MWEVGKRGVDGCIGGRTCRFLTIEGSYSVETGLSRCLRVLALSSSSCRMSYLGAGSGGLE
jgi:hypothetical protein